LAIGWLSCLLSYTHLCNLTTVFMPGFTDTLVPLKAAIIGCGLGGLSAAIALRRQGHNVTLYERYDFANEVGASLSCASNGSRFLEAWDVDIKAARPVVLKNLISHEWGTGEVTGVYSLGDYKKSFGSVRAMSAFLGHGN